MQAANSVCGVGKERPGALSLACPVTTNAQHQAPRLSLGRPEHAQPGEGVQRHREADGPHPHQAGWLGPRGSSGACVGGCIDWLLASPTRLPTRCPCEPLLVHSVKCLVWLAACEPYPPAHSLPMQAFACAQREVPAVVGCSRALPACPLAA